MTTALANIARMTTATTGTGTVTLGSAVSGFLTFADAGISNGDVVTYAIEENDEREVGQGTYSSTGPTLTRTTVYSSTASGSQITLTGGAEVFITLAADANGGITAPYIDTNRGKIRITPYMTTSSSYVDQSAQLKQAFIDFFDKDCTHLDFEGQMVGISSQIELICGTDGFTSTPSAPKNFQKRIVNGGIRWLGPDATGTYMLTMTCPTSISADAAFKEPGFESFRFDAGGGGTGYAIGCLEISNFYHAKFRDCTFQDFEDNVGVFLSSQDNSGNYTDDNGATFESCRFATINGDNQNTGTPIRAYCGDIVVEGGWSDFTGPMDFHIGSVTLDRVHFVNNLGSPTNRRYAAIFRDPRAITLINNDCDGGVFKFTNAGYLDSSGITSGSPTHGAETSFRNIIVLGNRMEGYAPITSGEGAITFETENAGTTLTGGIVIADNVHTQFDQGADATPFLKVITTGSGAYTSLSGVYRYVDAFGSTPGDTDFGAATHSVTSGRRYFSDDADIDITGTLDVGGATTLAGASFGSTVASSDTDLSDHLALYSTTYGLNVTSNNLNLVANGANTLSVRSGGIDISTTLNLTSYTGGPLITNASGTVTAGAWVAHGDNPKATTSGTSVTFSSIPSWATEIKLSFNGVSTNSASQQLQMRLGFGAAAETDNYFGRITSQSGGGTGHTTGFALTRTANYDAADTAYGDAIIRLADGVNRWNLQSMLSLADDSVLWTSGGSKKMTSGSTALDRITITTLGGTATFDAGSISLFYR